MDALTIPQAASVILAALTISLAALGLMSWRKPRSTPATADRQSPEVAFLFDGDALVDASAAGHRLLSVTPARDSDIARLVAFLSPRFPDFHDAVMASNELDALELLSLDGHSLLRFGIGGGRMRIQLEDTASDQDTGPDRNTLHAMAEELAIHRQVTAALPIPVWRQTQDGTVSWANPAYHEVATTATGKPGRLQQPSKIFDLDGPSASLPNDPLRVRIDGKDAATPRWFDCSAAPIGSDHLYVAVPADRVVHAENTLRDFVHTLTQTFAHLSVGLAIFDRVRRLTLFNPALTDLLGLAPEFLISRPSLAQVLDQLRERRMMPEPKDYKSWRQQMSALEAAAADGVYSETWSLADGRTFRVTGRPHPDGAVAFLFEDITAEISLTRRFRSELETSQAVIDSLDEAIAVFSPAGYLTISNRVYSELWDCDPSTSLGEISFLDATRRWQGYCAPTPVWGDARDFAATIGERANWSAEVRLKDGRRLNCRFDALPGGATLAAFSDQSGAIHLPALTEIESIRA